MVERPLIKSEVRGAIPRISEIKDIEQLINLVLKTTEYSLIQEIPSKIKILTSCLPTETKASSTDLNHGDVAQRWEFHSDMQKFNARHNPSRSFENMVMSYYQETKSECRIESFHTSGNQKKIDCFNVDWYCDHCKTVFEALGCYYHFYLHRRLVPHLARKILIEEKMREMDDLRRECNREKDYKIKEMWECEWWQNFKTNEKSKNHIRSNFPYKRPLSTDFLLGKVRDGSLYGYISCDLVVPDELKAKISNFPPFFKNTEVGRNYIGEFMQNYANENDLLKHPQRMLISSSKL